MRLVHTSDWQIGKAFAFADEQTRGVLRNERLEAILRLGTVAVREGAATVLVAGDVFDVASPSDRTLRQPIERMRQFPGIRWHLIPGNHDPHAPSGPWERLARMGLPENVIVHLSAQPVPVEGAEAWLLPAVLRRRHSLSDPTEAMDSAPTPEGAIRIGLAHGSITKFGSTETSTPNLITPDRVARAGLAYMALGDWHGAQTVGDRAAYSGTPEPDGFDLGGRGGGEALLVDIEGPRALPKMSFVRTGKFVWRSESATLDQDSDIQSLATRLRALVPDLSNLLLNLKVSGALSMQGRHAFEQAIQEGVGSAVRALRIDDDGLVLQPTAADLASLIHAGTIGVAAERLLALSAGASSRDAIVARAALQRLYMLYAREERDAG